MIRSHFPRLVTPDNLVFGKGSLITLRELKAQRVLLVTGKQSADMSGVLEKAITYLKAAGSVEISVFRVPFEPDWNLVKEGERIAAAFQPDWIVGLGGGAVLDTAKIVYALYECQPPDLVSIIKPFSIPQLRKKSQMALVPTTSGTGSEVSSAAALNDEEKKIKRILVSHEFLPDLALVDPLLVLSLPGKVTAFSGLDALTHAIEAYVSVMHQPISDACAVQAITLIMRNLLRAVEDGGRVEVREALHFASVLGGMAQNAVSVGITHSISHKLGAVFHVPHGQLNGLFLLPVIKFNYEKTRDRYEELSRSCGYSGCDEFFKALEELVKNLELPDCLTDVGIYPDDLKVNREIVLKDVLMDPCTRTNPRKPTEPEIQSLIESLF